MLPETVTWKTWGQIYQSMAVWRPVVKEIWPGLVGDSPILKVGIRSVRPAYPGTCAVFVVNETAVVKIFPPLVAGDFERERGVYQLLDGRLPYVPRLLGEGVYRSKIDWPYLVTEYDPGLSWREVEQTDVRSRPEVAADLGRWLHQLHGLPIRREEVTWSSPRKWSDFVQQRIANASEELAKNTNLTAMVMGQITERLGQVNWTIDQQSLLHSDLTPEHVLLTNQGSGGRISNIIDWADAEVGPPMYEWPALYFGFCHQDESLFKPILDAYEWQGPLDNIFRGDLFNFTLLHRFGSNIIAEVLTPGEQEGIDSAEQLEIALFGKSAWRD